MISKRRIAAAVVGVMSAGLLACSDTSPTDPQVTVSQPRSRDPLRDAVVAMGFRRDMIADKGSYFLVEGDVAIAKAGLGRPGGANLQYHHTNVVSISTVAGVTVDLTGLDSAWQTAARAAIDEWNSITPGVVVSISESSTSPNIRMFMRTFSGTVTCGSPPLPDNYAAATTFYSTGGGRTGDSTLINSSASHCMNAAKKKLVMAHEIGHALGIRHSNYSQLGESGGGFIHIDGTATSGNDAASVFVGGMAGIVEWNGFSADDKRAVFALYHTPALPDASWSFVDGIPTFSWTAMPDSPTYWIANGAESYFIDEDRNIIGAPIWEYHGSTSGTSIDLTGLPYTGFYECWQGTPNEQGSSYFARNPFVLEVQYPYGTLIFATTGGVNETVQCS